MSSQEIELLTKIHDELKKQTRILEQKFPPMTDTEKVVHETTKDTVKGKPCKFCHDLITFTKEDDGRFSPKNLDGTPHRCNR